MGYREKISIRISTMSKSQQAHTISKRMLFGQIRGSWQVMRQAKDNTHVTISYKPVRIQNRHKHTYHYGHLDAMTKRMGTAKIDVRAAWEQ